MRYIPRTTSTDAWFSAGARPSLDLIPPDLADLIRERDRILVQISDATGRVNELAGEHLDHAAELADAEAATAAARAGKPIPKPVAVSKLSADRTSAAEALQAQRDALAAVTNDCKELASRHYWDNLEQAQAARAKTRAAIETQARKLADVIEAAVAEGAAFDWLQQGTYYPAAAIWPTDLAQLSRHGLTQGNTDPVAVRTLIVNAATAALQED